MGRSKPVDLATRSFEKQGDATDFFKAMLNRTDPARGSETRTALMSRPFSNVTLNMLQRWAAASATFRS